MEIQKYFKDKKRLVDKALDCYLPSTDVYPSILFESMRYSVFAGGKRLRPILAIATTESLGRDIKDVMPVACCLEFIHTYSLIHDDLPAMDNDDLRRGKPTNHKVFGDAMAILTGDALLTIAFEIITKDRQYIKKIGADTLLTVIYEISKAAGYDGMIAGQVVDLENEGKEIDSFTLDFMHKHKTGALITAAIRTGAIISKASKKDLEILTEYGQKIGILYQIVDDILDITGDSKSLGKPVGSDLKNKKSTYPSYYGLDKAKTLAENQAYEAIKTIEDYSGDKTFFVEFVKFILNRHY